MPLISIVVPVYKVERYLNDCVSSIMCQSFKDFELILVDDGSPDGCPDICDEWATKDERIIVIHKANGGLSDARNVGFLRCSGKFVWFVDSDDTIIPESLMNLSMVISQNPNIELIHFNLLKTKKNKIEKHGFVWNKNVTILSNKEYSIKRLPLFPVMQFLIRKELLLNNHILFIKDVLHEDIPFGHMLIAVVNKVYSLNQILYLYRLRPESITTTPTIRSSESLIKSYKEIKNFEYKFFVKRSSSSFLWFKALYYDYFYEMFYRLYPFLGTKEYNNFMSDNGVYIKSEFNKLCPILTGKRKWLLYLFNISPELYSRIVWYKKNIRNIVRNFSIN